ncbi:putative calmodulin-dependent protein kinase [Filobasidium floriforme]|uniref:putative calmodulin-dependent protein kinase n=1 Tax=Filobasidium floriforme TaxID=5210 RepID=UPI001E8EDFFC|nr:putative calmodulin-dependent protein kinase [Filobasidium floriforme]KAH8087246.1 putative calmodulin-dependent protein kinase [Filobasidium floriforme]
MPAPVTVPCQYKTGRTLGSGTYAVVKEAVHITTGEYFACKVINKKLMAGREHMVRNEIAVLKRVSAGHPNICRLVDHFETAHNLYLVFDLCTGGELFDRICSKGNYYERDAAEIVRTITSAVKYLHDEGIVHRDLKPENLLFRSKADDAELCVADFGLSRIMDDNKFNVLTTTCGTPGYMAPEIFRKSGHGFKVDVWAIGVIAYFLLCGYTPFDRETQYEEMQAIIRGDYRFEPSEYWEGVSAQAKAFVKRCLTVDPTNRPTSAEILADDWLRVVGGDNKDPGVSTPRGGTTDLLPNVKKAFDAKKTFRKAVLGMMAMHRLQDGPSSNSKTESARMKEELAEYKREAEDEDVDQVLDEGNQGPGSDRRS